MNEDVTVIDLSLITVVFVTAAGAADVAKKRQAPSTKKRLTVLTILRRAAAWRSSSPSSCSAP